MPSADDIIKFIILLWFSFAFLAVIVLFFDKFLLPFIPKSLYKPFFFMLTSIVLPLFGLLSIYHTFCTLITYIPKKFLLLFSSILTIVLQIVFVDQILPYNSKFNTKYLIIQYICPVWQTYYSNYILKNAMLPHTEKNSHLYLVKDTTISKPYSDAIMHVLKNFQIFIQT